MPLDWRGPIKPLMAAVIRCGENSLPIYCLGVLLAFIAQACCSKYPGRLSCKAATSVAGVAIMAAAANLLTWESQLDRRGPGLF